MQIVNTCSADNPSNTSNASFDRNRYGQEQYNYQPNQPNDPNVSSVAFGTIDTGTPDTPDTIREPLLLPSPPKPVVNNKKNRQLNALKNSIDVATEPAQSYTLPNNNRPTTTADYTRSKTTPTPITLAAAQTTNQHTNPTNNSSNDTSANPPTLSETLPASSLDSAPDPLSNSLNDNLDNSDNFNLEQNQTKQESDTILDQKISFGKDDNKKSDNKLKKFSVTGFWGPAVSIIGSLLIVISVFLIFALLFRKISPTASQALPKEAFENLGRAFLSQKLQVNLLRLGNRLILVSTTNDSITPITEITDPDEVVAVLGMCRQLNNNGINKFHQNLSSQLNSPNHKNSSFAKKYKNQNDQNNYFGGDSSEENDSRYYRPQHHNNIDVYNEPDNSLAAILASGIERKGVKS
ncbi:MAG: hypothetical protein LBL39_01865 [Planctomycetaceae bacterium]|nr:hypothetical protein [Planctomycetaceae bacterium]